MEMTLLEIVQETIELHKGFDFLRVKALKESIMNNGFVKPLFIFDKDGYTHLANGSHRKEALKGLLEDSMSGDVTILSSSYDEEELENLPIPVFELEFDSIQANEFAALIDDDERIEYLKQILTEEELELYK